MLFFRLRSAAPECPLQDTSLSTVYGDTGLPRYQYPPVCYTTVNQKSAEHDIWHQIGCRSCWKDDSQSIQLPLGLHPGFSVWFTSLDELLYLAYEAFTHSVWFVDPKCPPFTPPPISRNGSTVWRLGVGLSCQRLFESHTMGTFHRDGDQLHPLWE